MDIKPVENGQCDGLGCGWSGIHCFCNAYNDMCNEYQRVTNKPWNQLDAECKHWDKAWRFLYTKVSDKK